MLSERDVRYGTVRQPTVEAYDWQAWPTVASTWSDVVMRCDHATFFVTTEWVQAWMDTFGAELKPTILLFRTDPSRVRGCCLLVRRTERKGPFWIRRLYLNTAGEDDRHSPCLEFNTLLCEPGFELTMALELSKFLERIRGQMPWDELCAPGLVGPAFDAFKTAFQGLPLIDQAKPSHYVDLEEVRASSSSYEDTLSSRERAHNRQNLRKYAGLGEIKLEQASTVDEALQFLDELVVLHQRSWAERGGPGSFSSQIFSQFHRQLIARCVPLGEIQLLRLRAGEHTVGCLYNFVYRSKVYFYQSGLDYSLIEKCSPGITVHIQAVAHATTLGLAEYDFMAGDVGYKRRLTAHHRDLHWATWKARTTKMRTLELLRRTKHKLEEHSFTDAKQRVLEAFNGFRTTLRAEE